MSVSRSVCLLLLVTTSYGILDSETFLAMESEMKARFQQNILPPVEVETPLGTVIGMRDNFTDIFLSVPYAKPPRRWEYPEYPDYNDTAIMATEVGPMCPQICRENPFICGDQISEDCLHLNIYKPSEASTTNRKPVVVFIHGGQFSRYSGTSSFLFDGFLFAIAADVVFVSINYRLGAMGFLATGKGPSDLRGNYGLADQKMALRWINHVIPSFGGDTDKITIMGQSSGATSVALLLLDDEASRHFQRVIIQSAPFGIPFKNYEDSHFQTQTIALSVGCPISDIDAMIMCMKSQPIQRILRAQELFSRSMMEFTDNSAVNQQVMWSPVMDNRHVPIDLISALKDIDSCGKDIMIGTTADESFFLVPDISYIKLLDIYRNNGNDITKFIELYPQRNPVDAGNEFGRSATDYLFVCPTRTSAKYLDINADNVYLYYFDIPIPDVFSPFFGPNARCGGKACHGSDLIYLFWLYPTGTFPPGIAEILQDMTSYWQNFIYTGNPNGSSLREWKRFKRGRRTRKHLVIEPYGIKLKSVPKEEVCKYWDDEGYN